MSKKSRKRNKKILAAIGLGLGAMALSKRKNKADLASTEDGKSGSTKITGGTNSNDYDSGTKKKSDSTMPDNLSKNTGKDNKAATPKNPYSIRTDKTPIKFGLGAQKGYTKTSIPKATTTTIQDSMPRGNTATGSLSFNDKIRANNERIKSGLKSYIILDSNK